MAYNTVVSWIDINGFNLDTNLYSRVRWNSIQGLLEFNQLEQPTIIKTPYGPSVFKSQNTNYPSRTFTLPFFLWNQSGWTSRWANAQAYLNLGGNPDLLRIGNMYLETYMTKIQYLGFQSGSGEAVNSNTYAMMNSILDASLAGVAPFLWKAMADYYNTSVPNIPITEDKYTNPAYLSSVAAASPSIFTFTNPGSTTVPAIFEISGLSQVGTVHYLNNRSIVGGTPVPFNFYGSLATVPLTTPGTVYTVLPTLAITAPDDTVNGVQATASIVGEIVTAGVTITGVGTGYHNPVIVLSKSLYGQINTANATPTLTGTTITSMTVQPGATFLAGVNNYYATNPTITILDYNNTVPVKALNATLCDINNLASTSLLAIGLVVGGTTYAPTYRWTFGAGTSGEYTTWPSGFYITIYDPAGPSAITIKTNTTPGTLPALGTYSDTFTSTNGSSGSGFTYTLGMTTRTIITNPGKGYYNAPTISLATAGTKSGTTIVLGAITLTSSYCFLDKNSGFYLQPGLNVISIDDDAIGTISSDTTNIRTASIWGTEFLYNGNYLDSSGNQSFQKQPITFGFNRSGPANNLNSLTATVPNMLTQYDNIPRILAGNLIIEPNTINLLPVLNAVAKASAFSTSVRLNLLNNSGFVAGTTTGWTSTNSATLTTENSSTLPAGYPTDMTTYYAVRTTIAVAQASGRLQQSFVAPGTGNFTLSGYCYLPSSTTGSGWFLWVTNTSYATIGSLATITPKNAWNKFTTTVALTAGVTYYILNGCDGGGAAGDYIFLADVQLEIGSSANAYQVTNTTSPITLSTLTDNPGGGIYTPSGATIITDLNAASTGVGQGARITIPNFSYINGQQFVFSFFNVASAVYNFQAYVHTADGFIFNEKNFSTPAGIVWSSQQSMQFTASGTATNQTCFIDLIITANASVNIYYACLMLETGRDVPTTWCPEFRNAELLQSVVKQNMVSAFDLLSFSALGNSQIYGIDNRKDGIQSALAVYMNNNQDGIGKAFNIPTKPNTNYTLALSMKSLNPVASTNTFVANTQIAASAKNWRSVTYGNGLFVAVANDGSTSSIMTSPDGITWTTRTAPVAKDWHGITYGNGLFVAVANDSSSINTVMTSLDGINWVLRNASVAQSWQSVTYGNDLFVAIASDGVHTNTVMTSSDGFNWITRVASVAQTWLAVTFGNSLFVAVSDSAGTNTVMTSPDGITWTTRVASVSGTWRSICFGNNLFVTLSTDSAHTNTVMTSPDGITWTTRTASNARLWRGITYGNGLFVAVAQDAILSNIMTSPDGTTWTTRTASTVRSWLTVVFSNGIFITIAYDSSSTATVMTMQVELNPIPVTTNNLAQIVFGSSQDTNIVEPPIFQLTNEFTTYIANYQSSNLTVDLIVEVLNASKYSNYILEVASIAILENSMPILLSRTAKSKNTSLQSPRISQNGSVTFTTTLPALTSNTNYNLFGDGNGNLQLKRIASDTNTYKMHFVRASSIGEQDFLVTQNIWDGNPHTITLTWENYKVGNTWYSYLLVTIDGTIYKSANLGQLTWADLATNYPFGICASDGNTWGAFSAVGSIGFPTDIPSNAVVTP